MKSSFFLSGKSVGVLIMLYLFLASLICFSYPVAALAGEADDLAKSANKMIRDAERNMFGKKVEQAAKMLEEARAKLDALKAADPSHRQLKSLESKYARIKKQLDKKLPKGSAAAPSPPKTTTVGEAKKAAGGKLPGGVSKRIRDIKHNLDNVDRYLAKGTDSSAKQADYILGETQSLFEEIDQKYGDQFDTGHPDYVAVKERFAALKETTKASIRAGEEKKADAAKAGAEKERQSAEWVPKFQAYLSYAGIEGHNPDMLVYVPGTSEPEKFADAVKRYEAFKAFYEEYKKVEFPHGKTEKLETLADKEAPRRLADFEKQFADRTSSVVGDAEKQISQAMTYLEKDKSWEKDSAVKPPIVDMKRMASIDKLVKNVSVALGPGSPDKAKIDKVYAALVAKDKEHRKIRADRTFLSPDIYKGGDKKDLVKKAGDIVVKEKSGSSVLRVTIYKDAWEEKTVEGWTDTSKTRWEKKTFRQINAHVGAKDSSGVYLHTLHMAQDKTSGGWGKLYGHIMYSDPMAEKNVNK